MNSRRKIIFNAKEFKDRVLFRSHVREEMLLVLLMLLTFGAHLVALITLFVSPSHDQAAKPETIFGWFAFALGGFVVGVLYPRKEDSLKNKETQNDI